MRKNISLLVIVFIAVVVATVLSPNNSSDNPIYAVGDTCTTGVSIVHPAVNQQVTGILAIDLAANTGVSKVVFELDGKILGVGRLAPSSGGQWSMIWDSAYSQPGGQYDLVALVTYQGGAQCRTQPIPVVVANTFQKPLDVVLNPPSWSGLTNSVALFELSYGSQGSTSTSVDLAQFADVKWSVSGKGSVAPELYGKSRYYSGPYGGNGTVKAVVNYGGQSRQVESQTIVYQQSTTTNSDDSTADTSTSSSSGTDSANDTSETGTQTGDTTIVQSAPLPAVEPARVLEQLLVDETFDVCARNRLGDEALAKFIQENRRPNSQEFARFITCFARQNYVVPSALAPVDPVDVPNKPESSEVVIKSLKNVVKIKDDGNEQETILLSGQAKPGAQVVLYVFSEPLVLATTVDDDGNWVYTLEDPLESGEHEVYALVDTGDGEYERSGVASFFIGTAEATDENPNSFSLELVSDIELSPAPDNRSATNFIAATIGLTVFVGTLLVSYVISRNRGRSKIAAMNESSVGFDTHENVADAIETDLPPDDNEQI